jgi:tetratricopeptide (TPR) repeat protein
MVGRIHEARALSRQSNARSEELGARYERGTFQAEYFIELLAGDLPAAAGHARAHCNQLEAMGERTVLSTRAGQLGRVLCTLGSYDEAMVLSHRSEEVGASDDALTQSLWRQVRARVLARRGDIAAALPLAHEAVRIAEATDALDAQGDALLDLAEVLDAAGDRRGAASAARRAVERYELKGNVVMTARARTRCAAIDSAGE